MRFVIIAFMSSFWMVFLFIRFYIPPIASLTNNDKAHRIFHASGGSIPADNQNKDHEPVDIDRGKDEMSHCFGVACDHDRDL